MSTNEPMRGPSVPGSDVSGPQDLVMQPNVATSEDWDQVPLPARQQLGWHENYEGGTERPELRNFTGKTPQELVHSRELTERNLGLVSSVTYHLESTPPPAEPAGAPGSKGYNELNRGVPAAEGFGFPGEFTLEDSGAGARTFRLPEGTTAPEGQQTEVRYTGLDVDPRNGSEDTRQVVTQTPSVNDPYRNTDGSLKDPQEVHKAAPAYPDSGFGSTDVVQAVKPAVEVSGAKADAPAGSEAQAARGSASYDVPDGTVVEVLRWVGDDTGRARAALEVEQSKESPRSSLVGQLNDRV